MNSHPAKQPAAAPNPNTIVHLCPNPCRNALNDSSEPCPAVCALADEDNLTPRERQALWLACLGLKNGTIAARMGITIDTARLHLRNLHRKTDTADKVDLVLKAWRSCVSQRKSTPRKK